LAGVTLFGLTQKTIAKLAGVTTSTVSRSLSKANKEPINKSGEHGKYLRYSVEDVRSFFRENVLQNITKKPCNVISFYNFKGGTGKTSMCFQVSSHLAMMGFDVLVIDADPQGHLSTSLGFDNTHSYPTLSDLISGVVGIEDAAHEIYPGLTCVPANLSLTRLEVALNELPKREERLKILLNDVKSKYDFIIFDTNPTISLLNRNILVCSDLISIICETQPYSLNGLKLLMEDMHKFYSNMQIKIPDIFLVPNKYEDRANSSAEAMAVLRQHYADFMFPDFAVRRSEEINTAAKLSQPLAFFARSNSIALEDVVDLIHALLMKLNDSIKFTKQAAQ
jgi:chromosome partitioning protein